MGVGRCGGDACGGQVGLSEGWGFVGLALVEAAVFSGELVVDESADERGAESGFEAELLVDVLEDG